MQKLPLTLFAFGLFLTSSCARPPTADASAEIIAMERASLDRWGKGDPKGYLDNFAPEMTYFDPGLEKRIDGFPAMQNYLIPLTGKLHVDHYDLISPKVQQHDDVALLTFQLISYGKGTQTLARWNSTEVYAQVAKKWKLIHSHWSYIKPDLKAAVKE